MISRALICAFFLLGVALPSVSYTQEVIEPSDYKMDHYRSPVPETLRGATTVGTERVHALWMRKDVAFVDVWPRAPKPPNLPKGTIFREAKRHSIPGSIWLPNVGYGAIPDIMDDYFRRGLIEITKNDKSMPVVIFCLDDCWMSWNAAKRAMEYGYSDIYWYPEGTDGWEFENLPLERVKAFPEPANQ